MSTTETTGPLPYTPQWLAAHKTCIGASEAAAACGLSPYATPLDIYARKRGLVEDEPDSDAMRLGRRLEPVILDEYETRNGCEIERPVAHKVDGRDSFIGATPDGLRLWTGDGHITIEAKATTWRRAKELGDAGSDEVPEDWLCQVQQQMLVFDCDFAHIAVLIDGRTLRVFEVARNDRLIKKMVEMERELWGRIEAGDPPPPDLNHPSTAELLSRLYSPDRIDGEEVAHVTADVFQAFDQAKELAAKMTALDKEKKVLMNQVKAAMGNAGRAVCPILGRELVRTVVKEQDISYTRKAYSYPRERETKPNG